MNQYQHQLVLFLSFKLQKLSLKLKKTCNTYIMKHGIIKTYKILYVYKISGSAYETS